MKCGACGSDDVILYEGEAPDEPDVLECIDCGSTTGAES